MKKFKFRLEKVLQYRELLKDEKRRELLKRNQELREAQERLEMLEQAARENKLAEGRLLHVNELVLAGLYAERLDREIIQQKLVIIDAEQAAEAALAEYIEAAKEHEALVILRKRRLDEYLEYVQKEEDKVLDEITVQKGNTAKRNEGRL